MSSSNNQSQGNTASYLDSTTSTIKDAVNKVTGSNTQDDKPSNGTYDQTIGAAKQSLGSAIGNENLRRTGEEQNARGQDEQARMQAQQWGEGAADRVKGKVGEALSGPRFGGSDEERMKAEAERREYKQLHQEGKAQQKEAERDIDQRWG
ncbi:hypothetical protein FQN55_005160 [Onygenales sp. PD_40]|nr:hypothetical protein FQN55_005160 [Onygenales sp. PD_40]